jgi:hypothetical protein
MTHRIAPARRRGECRAIPDIAVNQASVEPGRRGPAGEDNGLMPARSHRTNDRAAKVARTAGHEDAHGRRVPKYSSVRQMG